MEKKTIKRQLCITADMKKELVKIFNCTPRMVEKAMYLHESSDLARRIQKMARNKGAYAQVIVPEGETMHTYDHHMIQTFPNEAVLDIHMPTGECKVTHKGNVVKRISIVTIPELEQLQAEVAAL